ncbi:MULTISPECIES: hypothetical protein [unclassified Streptomyces]|uniref:hypothetical protein n=1 Tax=unclassified Streptomyces TaxID=2593676 RepID=UPI00166199D9|nr:MULTISPECIES: hypothetical protein [unclassified Streptomyces]MBD0838879.1 hypothetical protein [Streptomyces sp. TRM68416]
MRRFSVQGRDYVAFIVLSDDVDFDAMEVVEWVDGAPGRKLLEYRMDDSSAQLSFIRPGIDITLLRASLDVFREEFFEPRWASGHPCPPW